MSSIMLKNNSTYQNEFLGRLRVHIKSVGGCNSIFLYVCIKRFSQGATNVVNLEYFSQL